MPETATPLAESSGAVFKFRPALPGDIDMLFEWASQPHLIRWWANARDRSRFEFDMMARLEGDWLFPHIALLASRAIGYLQYYVAGVRGEQLRLDDARGILGIEFCIGERVFLRRGFGTSGLRHAADLLFREPAIKALVADPHPANIAAIKTYEKVGFRLVPHTPLTDSGGLLLRLVKPTGPWPSG